MAGIQTEARGHLRGAGHTILFLCLTLIAVTLSLIFVMRTGTESEPSPVPGERDPAPAAQELRETAVERGLWLVSGRVVSADGLPLPGWRVVLREEEGLGTVVRTDPEGHFCMGVDMSRSAVDFDIEPPAGAGSKGVSGVSAFRFEDQREVDLGDVRVAGVRR